MKPSLEIAEVLRGEGNCAELRCFGGRNVYGTIKTCERKLCHTYKFLVQVFPACVRGIIAMSCISH